MKIIRLLWGAGCLLGMLGTPPVLAGELFLPTLCPTVERLVSDAERIPEERRTILDEAARVIQQRLAAGEPANLVFICTHNSRRSQLAQVWSQVAARYYGLDGIRSYSGGTEVTACNPRTIAALQRAGFEVAMPTADVNPHYGVRFAARVAPLELYSKVYDAAENASGEIIAMMCCSDADERCPVVSGALVRVPLHYEDPKVADDSPQETALYDERSGQIGREMFYIAAAVAAAR